MVHTQLEARGIRDHRVLEAFRTLPREPFLPPSLRDHAYDDAPTPLGHGQTISQPYVVAVMLEALRIERHERVLEVGTGSGYSAALLSRLAAEVFTVERVPELSDRARHTLDALGVPNVQVIEGDGTLGLASEAPFEAIVVAAGGTHAPPALLEQLSFGGRLVIPIGSDVERQVLTRFTRIEGHRFEVDDLLGVRFVPLIGAEGHPE